MKKAALLTSNLHRYDAVSLDLCGLQYHLQQRGYEAYIFCDQKDPGLQARHTADLPGFLNSKEDIMVLSYAGHWPRGEDYFQKSPAFRILRYHNVTPPEFYEPYDAGLAHHCRVGRSKLPALIQTARPDLFLADSAFNATDLYAGGAPEHQVHVLPVFHQIDDLLEAWQRQPGSPGSVSEVASSFGRMLHPEEKLVLMVGRLVPNKGYENLLKAFARLQARSTHSVYLFLAGSSYANLSAYYRRLERIINNEGLAARVLQSAALTTLDLGYLYKRADLFAIMSEHEGFCVPVVEAMASGTPVVALARAAVGETLGQAGLLFQEFDEATIAAAMDRVLTDVEISKAMSRMGKDRYNTVFHNQAVGQALDEILNQEIARCA